MGWQYALTGVFLVAIAFLAVVPIKDTSKVPLPIGMTIVACLFGGVTMVIIGVLMMIWGY